jgi:hypothetical protein
MHTMDHVIICVTLLSNNDKKILNPKTWYDTIKFSLIVERSKPLHYKIVRFSKPKFRSHDIEFYIYLCIRVKFVLLKDLEMEVIGWSKVVRGVSLTYDKNICEWFT